jgi:hypothetical protein
MSAETDRIDEALLSLVGDDPVIIRDLTQGGNYHRVRAAIDRLHEKGLMACFWDGNQRFGRNLYWRKKEDATPGKAIQHGGCMK